MACIRVFIALLVMAAMCPPLSMAEPPAANDEREQFEALRKGPWEVVFEDPGTDDWHPRWTLDGEKATVRSTPEGMEFRAGPTPGDDACHAVLWTRISFQGDLKIEYEYTRLDDAVEFVTILYVQATGSGEGPYVNDISEWSEMRTVPAMRLYYNHMHTYHISYAAFDHGNTDPDNDYVRARRYVPETEAGLTGTEIAPSYDRTGLFAPGVPHRITVIKNGQELFFRARGPDAEILCHWENRDLPPIEEGRIGLRHMYTRSARYRDIRVSVPKE